MGKVVRMYADGKYHNFGSTSGSRRMRGGTWRSSAGLRCRGLGDAADPLTVERRSLSVRRLIKDHEKSTLSSEGVRKGSLGL